MRIRYRADKRDRTSLKLYSYRLRGYYIVR